MIAVTKKKAGGFLLGFTLSIITLGTIGLSFNTNTTFAKKEVLNKDIAISNVKNNYNTYVKTTKDTVLYDIERKNIGTLKKDTEIILDDNYNIIDKYYKLSDSDYYVLYSDVIKSDGISYENTEYKTYKNYVAFNKNIITKSSYKLKADDKELYTINKSDSYQVIVNSSDKYGVEFDNRLFYIDKSDVETEEDIESSGKEYADGIAVLNYHYTVNKEASELLECTQSICMEDTQVEEEIKYLNDNGFYATTMRDLELYVKGEVRLPAKSISITIDDGWYVSRMINILNKYQMMGTLFLIGSLASPNDYKSDYLEIHSHSWNMHTPKVCTGRHGGAILCWTEDKILEDLKKSRESLNNTPYYCFPFYEYNNRAVELVEKAGFRMAFIGGSKKVYPGDNLYKIHRYELDNTTTIQEFSDMIN